MLVVTNILLFAYIGVIEATNPVFAKDVEVVVTDVVSVF
jgi:hypothetical protein